MRSISENDLTVIILLLARRISEIRQALDGGDGREDTMSDEAFEQQTDSADLLSAYERTMDRLREEYEAARLEGIVLPDLDELTGPLSGKPR